MLIEVLADRKRPALPHAGVIETSEGGAVSAAAGQTPSASPAPSGTTSGKPVEDGLYLGGNHALSIELRIDCGVCGVISADLFRLLPDARHYVASVRTLPGRPAQWPGNWPIIGQDEHDRRAQGTLTLEPLQDLPGAIGGRIEFDDPLEGLPIRRPVPFVVERSSSYFRRIGIEIEIEEDVRKAASYRHDDREITIESSLNAAGFDTYLTGITDRIPQLPAGGWDIAQLHTLMSDFAQAPLTRRAWEVHLLFLSRSDRKGLLGVMFDSSDSLPRQGCAVFAEEIRAIQGLDHDRKIIQTTVHELGHALNLAHRFERVVGRADSLSFMNYDWRYRGGDHAPEFWSRFAFSFDPDELEFLRHAPLSPVIPGGAAFHSIAYWSDGSGGYSRYLPEAQLPGWNLVLAPAGDDRVFRFAQPVLMRCTLTNRSDRTVKVPKFLLDPKAGFLEVLIRRGDAGVTGSTKAQAKTFAPAVQRCFEWDAADDALLPPGYSLEDNVNLTFGSSGFAFAEPGSYDITAMVVLSDQADRREMVVASNTVRIRVGAPRSDDEERDAMDFFSTDVGLYLAFGGAPALSGARDKLERIVERRGRQISDPVVTHLIRAMAIDKSRHYVRYREGRFHRQAPDMAAALADLEHVLKAPGTAVDPATRHVTESLANQCREHLNGPASGQRAVSSAIGPRILTPSGAGAPRGFEDLTRGVDGALNRLTKREPLALHIDTRTMSDGQLSKLGGVLQSVRDVVDFSAAGAISDVVPDSPASPSKPSEPLPRVPRSRPGKQTRTPR